MRQRRTRTRIITSVEATSRRKDSGFLWIPCLALVAYLGVGVAAGQRDFLSSRAAALPEDLAAEDASHGEASWYGPGFHGNPTASGETYDMHEMTAAHRTLPLGTRVLVRNLKNDRTVVVRINDRGPYVDGREIDLSYAAAQQIGMLQPGLASVEVVPF
ncbi:MAG TPA: septal ring lytic transglycosylase RlpA family protein [Thermoanaerobaculia bacterium]